MIHILLFHLYYIICFNIIWLLVCHRLTLPLMMYLTAKELRGKQVLKP